MSSADGYSISALGTACSLIGYGVPPSVEARQIFVSLIQEMDVAASRFREDSELSRIFNGKALSKVVVSEILFDAIDAALFAAVVTNGYLDPTVAGSLVAMGYKADFSEISGRSEGDLPDLQVVLPPGYRNIRLHRGELSVSVSEGVTLDLGSTGKAFLADRIRHRIELELAEHVLVNLGGDISASLTLEGESWPVKITDDGGLDPFSSGVIIQISGGGVATSSTLKRSWRTSSGIRAHHIIDPRTGISANSPFESVTVVAGSALDANIASCGTIAMGSLGPEWLESTRLPAIARARNADVRYFGAWEGANRIGSLR